MVSVTPSGFPIRDGSVLQGFRYRSTACLWSIAPTELPFRDGTPGYRGCATAPPPACDPSLLRSFHFAMARRVTGVPLPLHRLPVIHRSYGASISRWHAVLQGFRYRSTTCLWSFHPFGVSPARREGNRWPDERMNANSTKGQTPLRRENECHFDERTIVNPRKPRRGERPQAGGEARKGATPVQ